MFCVCMCLLVIWNAKEWIHCIVHLKDDAEFVGRLALWIQSTTLYPTSMHTHTHPDTHIRRKLRQNYLKIHHFNVIYIHGEFPAHIWDDIRIFLFSSNFGYSHAFLLIINFRHLSICFHVIFFYVIWLFFICHSWSWPHINRLFLFSILLIQIMTEKIRISVQIQCRDFERGKKSLLVCQCCGFWTRPWTWLCAYLSFLTLTVWLGKTNWW